MQIKLLISGLIVVLLMHLFNYATTYIIRIRVNPPRQHRVIIHQTCTKFGHDPHSTILSKFHPSTGGMLFKKVKKLNRCYSDNIQGQKLNIFKTPLSKVVHNYLTLFGFYEVESTDSWRRRLIKRIRNLLRTIRLMAKNIIECVKNEDPNFEPTQIGINKFAVLSPEQFKKMYPPLPKPNPNNSRLGPNDIDSMYSTYDVSEISDSAVPATFDYRNKGVVSGVKNQGGGQTCYIFSSVGAIESSYMLAHKKRGVSFSEQDALNCLQGLGYIKDPVQGGFVETVMKLGNEHGMILHSKGEHYFADPYNVYPPVAHSRMCQKLQPNQQAARVKGFAKIDNFSDGEMTLKKIIFKYGPVTTLFRSPHRDFYWNNLSWKYNRLCDTREKVGHSMLIVGWDRTHWIIKNSYGDDGWGIRGYLYLNKKSAVSCAVMGPDSQIVFPNVE